MANFTHYFSHMSPTMQTASAAYSSSPSDSAVLSLFVFAILAVFVIVALIIVSNWIIFQKAGKPGWASIVPFYNRVVALDIAGKPLWWALLFILPVVNIVFLIIVARRIAANFGKGAWFTVGMIFLPYIFLPILAFGRATYHNVSSVASPLSEAGRWAFISLFAFLILELPFFIAGIVSSLVHAEPLTVISEGYGYAADDSYVYYDDVPVDGADPESFVMDGLYGVDANHVYYNGIQVKNADASTFKSVGEDTDSDYGTDAHAVYYDGTLLEGADSATFTILKDGFARDKNGIYDYGSIIKNIADPDTFSAVGGYYATDANTVYYLSTPSDSGSDSEVAVPVVGADKATFTTAYNDSDTGVSYDAKDKNHYYNEGKVVK